MTEGLHDLKLGESDQQIPVTTSEDCTQLMLSLAQQAQHSLRLWSYDLDPRLTDTSEFVQAVRELATRHPRNEVRILVLDPDRAVKQGHRLIELSRRLPSSIEIRKIMEDYAHVAQAFVIADERGILDRDLADRFEGTANFNAPLRARELTKLFDEVWQKSQQFSEFRRLHL